MSTVLNTLETPPSPESPETYGAFLKAVAAHTYLSDESLNENARSYAISLAEVYLSNLAPSPEPVTLLPGHAVLHAVKCNEGNYSKDPDYWV